MIYFILLPQNQKFSLENAHVPLLYIYLNQVRFEGKLKMIMNFLDPFLPENFESWPLLCSGLPLHVAVTIALHVEFQ